MVNKKRRAIILFISASLVVLCLIIGFAISKFSDKDYSGVWDYPEAGVVLQIFDDNTWEMLDETDTVIAGGYLELKADKAELYYSYGSPWGEEDGPVLYNVLSYKRKGVLSDAIGESLTLKDDNPISHSNVNQ